MRIPMPTTMTMATTSESKIPKQQYQQPKLWHWHNLVVEGRKRRRHNLPMPTTTAKGIYHRRMSKTTTTIGCWLPMLLLSVLMAMAQMPMEAHALDCIQCNRQTLWYSPEDNERHIVRCQRGLIPATRCANTTHTHCIYSYYKQGGVMTVTERRCGTAEEISGCTLYKSLRSRRHFVSGAGMDMPPPRQKHGNGVATSAAALISHRRRETGPLVVEVCNGGCQTDGCVSGAGTMMRGRGVRQWAQTAGIVLVALASLFSMPIFLAVPLASMGTWGHR